MKVTTKPFGTTYSGKNVALIRLENDAGMYAEITNYGATLVSLGVPGANGDCTDVVLGFDSVRGYEDTRYYMGATIGRHAGQIKKGRFTLGETQYSVVVNDHDHTMHGGPDGFHHQVFGWCASDGQVDFFYLSPDGEAGFPGNLQVTVRYQLTKTNELVMEYFAQSDRDTVLNMTNHSYFNLDGKGDILGHRLRIEASAYTQVDDQGLPTGKILPVKGTPYDFSEFSVLGAQIDCEDEQLKWCGGYDHNWVLNPAPKGQLRLACELQDTAGKTKMKLFTNQPGLQMYSGNYMDGKEKGKQQCAYGYRGALCLEPQLFPNGMECPNFPSPVLKAGQPFYYHSMYQFV